MPAAATTDLCRMSPVAEFYRDQSILITGASGFMGKVLVEKLLRSCSGVKNIYLLLRSKGKQNVQERLQDLLTSKVFERACAECPGCTSKVHAVQGDICMPKLGLSQSDMDTLIREVSIVFHAAATVKFDEPLRISVELNLQGTKHVMEVAKQMPLLKALVHVSTAYCNCDREEIEEIVYPPPMDPQFVIDTLQWMDDETLEVLTPKLIKGRPNTYTFTKALAESYLSEHCKSLPIAIVRPSIVTAAWKEPYPGWVDSLNGPTGLYVAASKGLLRTMIMEPDAVADFIPVDIAINLMLAVAWNTCSNPSSTIKVYNCTSGSLRGMTWGQMETFTFPALVDNPSMEVFRYPCYSSTPNRIVHLLKALVQHYLPAAVVDTVSLLLGKKARMIRLYNKIHRAVDTMQFFTTNQWKFHCNNVQSFYGQLAEEDQQVFDFNIQPLDWPTYMKTYALGIREFLLKEASSTISTARCQLRNLYIKTQLVNLILGILVLRLAIQKSKTVHQLWFSLVSIVLRIYQRLSFSAP